MKQAETGAVMSLYLSSYFPRLKFEKREYKLTNEINLTITEKKHPIVRTIGL